MNELSKQSSRVTEVSVSEIAENTHQALSLTAKAKQATEEIQDLNHALAGLDQAIDEYKRETKTTKYLMNKILPKL